MAHPDSRFPRTSEGQEWQFGVARGTEGIRGLSAQMDEEGMAKASQRTNQAGLCFDFPWASTCAEGRALWYYIPK